MPCPRSRRVINAFNLFVYAPHPLNSLTCGVVPICTTQKKNGETMEQQINDNSVEMEKAET